MPQLGVLSQNDHAEEKEATRQQEGNPHDNVLSIELVSQRAGENAE
jgi:hypothetical protein